MTEPYAFTLIGELWRLTREGHSFECRVGVVEGIGFQVRFELDGDLFMAHAFTTWLEVERSAKDKRTELKARGWTET